MKFFSGTRIKPPVDYISRRRRMRIAVILSALAILAFALSVVGAAIDRGPFSSAGGSRPVPKSAILNQWKAKDYDTVLQSTGNSLGARPIDPFYLVFNGLASFYKAVAMPESDERTALLDNTVVSIDRGEQGPRSKDEHSHPSKRQHDFAQRLRSRESSHRASWMHCRCREIRPKLDVFRPTAAG